MAKKKAEHLPELSETLIEPDPNDPNATILELDELWSFVLKKVNTSWIWIALCRKTRQVVSYAIGDRSKETCQKLGSGKLGNGVVSWEQKFVEREKLIW